MESSSLSTKVFVCRKELRKIDTSPVDELDGKELSISPATTMKSFLKEIEAQLCLNEPAIGLMTADGEEITDLAFVKKKEKLYVLIENESAADAINQEFDHFVHLDDYKLRRFLGEGSFGKVFLATHNTTGDFAALKFLTKNQLQSLQDVDRILTEIQVLHTLKHPNVISLQNVLNLPDSIVLALEYANEGELGTYLKKQPKNRLPENIAAEIFSQMVDGVTYCHRRHVVHYDLKLENILLSRLPSHTKPTLIVKIADFGFSHLCQPGKREKNYTAGSLYYLAPEVFKQQETYGPSRDIWALGILLFYLVLGRFPFSGSTAEAVKSAILAGKLNYKDDTLALSSSCRSVIQGMLRLEPDKRLTLSGIRNSNWLENFTSQRPYTRSTLRKRHTNNPSSITSPKINGETKTSRMTRRWTEDVTRHEQSHDHGINRRNI